MKREEALSGWGIMECMQYESRKTSKTVRRQVKGEMGDEAQQK